MDHMLSSGEALAKVKESCKTMCQAVKALGTKVFDVKVEDVDNHFLQFCREGKHGNLEQ